jgi:DNA-binding transcriptional LysR family regulator
MEFDQLKGFYFVAKLGSFTEAGTHLFVTQPAISQQVKALECEIGERLFDRIGRTIRLTHAGHTLYKHVEDLIGKLDEIQIAVAALKNLEAGRLHLGASDTTSMYFLPELLKAFLAEHPKIEIRISSLVSKDVLERVLARDIELGIVTLGGVEPPLEAIALFEERFVCIARVDHPLASRKVVDAKDVAAEPLVCLDRGSVTRAIIDEYFQKAGQKTRPVVELSNFEIIKRYVAAGLGLAIVPEPSVDEDKDKVCALELREPLKVGMGAVFRRDREFSRPARAFLAMAQDHFRPPARRSQPSLVGQR